MAVAAADRGGRKIYRSPHIGGSRSGEPCGHHTNYRVGFAVQLDCFVDGVGAAAEMRFPKCVGHYRDVVLAFRVFTGNERAAELRRDAENRKEIRLRLDQRYFLRGARAAHVAGLAPREHRHIVESAILRAPIEEILIGEREIAWSGFGFPKLDEVIGLGERQRLQQHGMDDGEDCRVRADAERDCQHGDDGEARRFAKHAKSVFDVLNQSAHFASVSRKTHDCAVNLRGAAILPAKACDCRRTENPRARCPRHDNEPQYCLDNQSLVAQCDHWIYAHCPAGRDVTCRQGHDREESSDQ